MLWRSGGSVTGIAPLALPLRVTLAWMLAQARAVDPVLARAAQPITDSARASELTRTRTSWPASTPPRPGLGLAWGVRLARCPQTARGESDG